MITHSLDVVLSKPGIWVVCTRVMTFFIEVEASGRCHQLNPRTFERDGILGAGRWNLGAGAAFNGPLARPSVPATKEST